MKKIQNKQILKRHGNYILRTREIKNNNLVYTWFYSKELSNIIKQYGKIEEWQFNNILDGLNLYNHCYPSYTIKNINFSFKRLLRMHEEYCIKMLLQYSNGVGEYA